MDKAAFAMASRTTTPVKDDLVERLAGIFPVLKSGEGIPVVKHTKRGQSDHRRLRLDTDDSTLEVFRRGTTASYLNRKMSNRRYNLRMLEEVRERKREASKRRDLYCRILRRISYYITGSITSVETRQRDSETEFDK